MKPILLVLVWGTILSAQQLTLSIVGPPGQIRAGSTMQIQVALAGSSGKNLAAWEGVVKSSVGGTWKMVEGPVATAAAKTFTCLASTAGDFKCVIAGINQNVFADGVVGTYSLDIPSNAAIGQATVTASGFLGATLAGDALALTANSLNFTTASPISKCDLNGDGAINALDVQAAINQVLGLAQCSMDLDADGKCTAIDLMRVILAALGGACRIQGGG